MTIDQLTVSLTGVEAAVDDLIVVRDTSEPHERKKTKKMRLDQLAIAMGALLVGSFQPLDDDLTAIAALTTTEYGRSLLTVADAGAARTSLSVYSAAQVDAADAAVAATAAANLAAHTGNTSNPHAVTKAQVGLSLVENTALSTWAGSSSLTTLGTIGTGTWQATAIADGYIASAATWNAKEPAIVAGATAQYWRGDKTWATLNQAAVAGLTISDSPTFAGLSTGSGAISGGAISGTTGTFSGVLTSTQTANFLQATAATANDKYGTISNNNGTLEWGVTAAGNSFFGASAGGEVRLQVGGSPIVTVNASGGNGAWGQTTPAAGSFTTLSVSAYGAIGIALAPSVGFRSLAPNAASNQAITAIENAGVHQINFRPNYNNAGGGNFITSDYLSGSTYLPLCLSGRGNAADFILSTAGNASFGGNVSVSGTLGVTGTLGASGNVWSGSADIDVTTGATDGSNLNSNGTIIASSAGVVGFWRRRSSDGSIIDFHRDTTNVGSISVTTTSTAYNTSSDARLKTNVRPLTNSGSIIDALKPSLFDWKSGEKDSYGFIAQEVHTVFPQAVTKGDDDPDTITQQWAMDASKFMPLAIAELKSLRARVKELEAKLAA